MAFSACWMTSASEYAEIGFEIDRLEKLNIQEVPTE
jgi:hypothetical protein